MKRMIGTSLSFGRGEQFSTPKDDSKLSRITQRFSRPMPGHSWQYRSQHTKGYQSLGSFHSEDLGAVMALSDDDYQPPALPFDATVTNPSEGDFFLDRSQWTFLNHGAFGAALSVGYHRASQWRRYLEEQPLRYFDRALLPHLAYSARRLAAFGSSTETTTTTTSLEVRRGIALIQNATSGTNSVLRGFQRVYGSSAHVIVWDTTYGSVKKLGQHIFGPLRMTEIPLQQQYLTSFQTTKDPTQVFLQALEDTLSKIIQNDHKFLLVLDHTTSNTAITMPINHISQHVKKNYDNIQILVDGAHGLLAQDVNLQQHSNAGVDYYIANGHKWLSCPRGVGLLYCPHPHLHETVLAEPAIISHGVDEPDLMSRFTWDGCRDYGAALAVPAVLDYWQDKRPETVRATLKSTLMEAIQRLAYHWHNDCPPNDWLNQGVTIVPNSLLSPMALVRLPKHLSGTTVNDNRKTSADAKRVQDFLYDHYIEVPIKCINGQLYVRVSCHIYNEVHEFDRLGEVLMSCSP